MDGSLEIGRIFGIPVRLHVTFLLIIPLFAWIIGSQIGLTVTFIEGLFAVPIDRTIIESGFIPYIMGAVVALALFFCVFVHELAHSLIARANGIKINSITLIIFGGVASMEDMLPDPKVELPMALAGPLTSLGLGLISWAMVYVVDIFVDVAEIAGIFVYGFGYLALLNILLFAFNLLPAFPMDGGRVLRAWLAGRMPLHRATRIASDIGKGFAILFGIFGILSFNFLLIIIAFFIYIGASQESSMVTTNFLLQDVTVGEIMTTDVVSVEPTRPLIDVIRLMYTTKHLGFPVIERGDFTGIITLADIHKTSEIDREAMQVRDVMTRQPIITISPAASVTEALKIMTIHNIGRIPVLENGTIVGIVTRTDILTVLELKEVS
ncbi:MAG: CBS domain-containing protein [Methanocalculus sp. MSAO_Arc1]|uniref:CBS domain-containing protein n=1 Tax=Methanocalculus TaxID=71151 RepID=UPI000FF34880|nr:MULTISPECIES: CBS domain-containing protein [unclassified Methanocalculus]MCP1662205.1 Zn-dependent protease/predicted transcriptional regulator [Methanocalculus sp. AMF5]RQD81663.1 MAG: CBS domain-containing protein [Methanocalculus sp. MSAO_Arc1]